jgi:hypothetical protein
MPSIVLELTEPGPVALAVYAELRPGEELLCPRELRLDAARALPALERHAARLHCFAMCGYLRHLVTAGPAERTVRVVLAGDGLVEVGAEAEGELCAAR